MPNLNFKTFISLNDVNEACKILKLTPPHKNDKNQYYINQDLINEYNNYLFKGKYGEISVLNRLLSIQRLKISIHRTILNLAEVIIMNVIRAFENRKRNRRMYFK